MEKVLLWIAAIIVVLTLGAAGAFGGCCVGLWMAATMGPAKEQTPLFFAWVAAGVILGLVGGGFLAGKWIIPRGP